MPNLLNKRCRYPGCPRTTRTRFCDEHSSLRYLADRRPSSYERGYDCDWEHIAKQRRELDAHLCQRCLEVQRFTPASTVDHIIPIHVRADWRLELGNTQVLCSLCHAAKTKCDNQRYGRRGATVLTSDQQAERSAALYIDKPEREDDSV